MHSPSVACNNYVQTLKYVKQLQDKTPPNDVALKACSNTANFISIQQLKELESQN